MSSRSVIADSLPRAPRLTWISIATLFVWLAMTFYALELGLWQLAGLTTLQAGAMLVGAWLALRAHARPTGFVYDALAAGVLIASALLYVIPSALAGHAASGMAGMVAGLAVGLVMHCSMHASPHRSMLGALCLHAASAGVVLGVVYSGMPALCLSLGLAIVAHKLPAGYALARALRDEGQSSVSVLLPACAVGLASLPIAVWSPYLALPHGLLFGLASGLFLTVGYAYLAHLPWRSRGRAAAIASMIAGGLLVLGMDIALQTVG